LLTCHAEEWAFCELAFLEGFSIDRGVELFEIVFKRYTVHEDAVERVVKGVVHMEARFLVFSSLGQDTGKQIARVRWEVSAWFSDYFVSKGISSCCLKSGSKSFVEITGRISTTEIKNFHGVTHFSADFDALMSNLDCFEERRRSVFTWTAVEVNSVDLHLEFISNVLEFLFSVFWGDNVITKFIWEHSG